MSEERELYGFEEEDLITLEFDGGEEVECGSIGVFDFEGRDYIALNPLGTEDVFIYGYKEYEEEFELVDITDDEEFEKVAKEFDNICQQIKEEAN